MASERQGRTREKYPLGVWVLASRPRTLTAAIAPVAVGTGLAAGHGSFRPLPALAAFLGAVLIQIGTNLANDYYDHERGGDTEDRIGPVRVTQAGLLPPESVRNGAFLVLGMALLLGIYLVSVGGWPVLVIGVTSLVCAVAYTGGPFPLAYHGLGDLFVFVFFGLVAVGGTYWVQALEYGPDGLLAGSGMGALATAILVVNNLRDLEADARAGKRTLAVRIGRTGTKFEFMALLALAFCSPVVGVLVLGWKPAALLSLLGLLLLLGPASAVVKNTPTTDPRTLIQHLGRTAQAAGLYGLLLGLGLAWS